MRSSSEYLTVFKQMSHLVLSHKTYCQNLVSVLCGIFGLAFLFLRIAPAQKHLDEIAPGSLFTEEAYSL